MLISALYFRGNECDLTGLLVENRTGIISSQVQAEVERWIWKHVAKPENDIENLRQRILPALEIIREDKPLPPELASRLRDQKDAPILSAFLASGAEMLATGDNDLLSLGDSRIARPKECLRRLKLELSKNR